MCGKWWIVFLCAVCCTSWGQVLDPAQEIVQETLELLEDQMDEQELLQWSAELEVLLQHPIPINYADAEQLLQIPFLTLFHVHQILSYRKKVRKIYTIYELVHTTTLTEKELYLLQQLVNFSTQRQELPSLDKLMAYGKHQIVTRWQRELTPRAGYDPQRRREGSSHYTGDPNRILLKYQWRFADRIHFHLTGEKDAGEPFAASHQPLGFDFTSAHFALQGFKRIETAIIGDYNLQFGQGLALWNGMAPRYNPDVTQVWRLGRGIRPYRGVDENRFFRGVALKWRLHRQWTLHTFLSHNRISATQEGEGFTNLRNTGLHRTPTEIVQRRNLKKTLEGAHLRYTRQRFDAGFTYYRYSFDLPQIPNTQPHNAFQFSGKVGWTGAIDYRYVVARLQVFGEWAWHNKQLANVNGLQWRPTERLTLAAMHRVIPAGFQTPYTTVFGGNTAGNYEATYLSSTLQLTQRSSINAFTDWISYPFWRFGMESLSRARRSYLQFDYERFKRYRFSIRYRHNQTSNMADLDQPTRKLAFGKQHQFRIHVQWQLHPDIILQARWEATASESTSGTAAFQELRYTKGIHKVVLRYSAFNTKDFASAIYTFEPDLPMGFSVPALYGNGNRIVVLYTIKTKAFGEWGLRLARQKFFDRETIGSGLDETPGNSRMDLRAFVRWKF